MQDDPLSAAMRARAPGQTLVDTLVDALAADIVNGRLRAGQRLPSVRELARRAGVSSSTATTVWDKMVALGHVEARRGSGYYVRALPGTAVAVSLAKSALASRTSIDAAWLARILREGGSLNTRPGSGSLPDTWFDNNLVQAAVRAVGRRQMSSLIRYGEPLGWLPLRSQLCVQLADIGVQANPRQIITTAGVAHAIELVVGKLLRSGDAVLVDDPGWFVLFEKLRSRGLRILPVPWLADGPDLDRLDQLARSYQPRLFITQPVRHNPTGGTISVAKAHRLLQLAQAHDFLILENDVWGELAPAGTTRIATLDQLQRVVYASSFSKTLAAGLRVGFIACDENLVEGLIDQKLAAGLTTSELNERVLHWILSEGHYRRGTANIRDRLARMRDSALLRLEATGLRLGPHPPDGLFAWAQAPIDTSVLAERAAARGYVLAPGRLFSAGLSASSWMRVNLSACTNAGFLAMLKDELQG
ncbi:MAG TPA: PLP-dependent aminotransferase family protein [Ramlibacter sp.]|nr:PLP-dependent aminotransferase family protein [Ramlibacter sp.]